MLLSPLAAIYDAVATRRMTRAGARMPVPVICVGNPTVGGAGKTPTAIALVRLLQRAGRKPAFLTRGYGGRHPGPIVVAASHDASEVGDEPLLLARVAPTVVARDRMAGARAAIAAGADVLVMDDGFQNSAVAKDLAILERRKAALAPASAQTETKLDPAEPATTEPGPEPRPGTRAVAPASGDPGAASQGDVFQELTSEVDHMIETRAGGDLHTVLLMVLEAMQRGAGFDRVLFGLVTPDKQSVQGRLAIGPRSEPVVFELLAPNARPVQTTRDLRSFWENTYPEVRKELRGRYPKHPWPEDPWTATPTHRTTRRPRR